MRQLLNELDDMTQLEAGTLDLWTQPTRVEHLLEQAREAHSQEGNGKHRIEVAPARGLPKVTADAPRVCQVLRNLIDQASGYPSWPSVIRLSASPEDAFVKISVETTKPGGPTVNPLRDMDNAAAWSGNESDQMSLEVCKGIVEAHGGSLSAERDDSGHAVRFSFTVPLASQEESSPETGEVRPTARSGKSAPGQARILVVDDDLESRRCIERILTEAGFRPVVTSSADDAELMVETEHPHLVLTDLTLSWTNGLELMQRIGRSSDAPVIIMSEHNTAPSMDQAFKLGAADYIAKPNIPAELASRIRAALRRQGETNGEENQKTFTLGRLTINHAQRIVSIDGRPVKLTATEYRLLSELSTSAGQVLSHDQLLRRAWGSLYSGDPRIVRTYIKTLRQKLGDDANKPDYIVTEPGFGYRMQRPEDEPGPAGA